MTISEARTETAAGVSSETNPEGGPRDSVARSTDARLARLHLRGGMLALARTELERMAAAGTLDTPALADLAEARWRSGDLLGAAEPARAHMAAGGSEPIGMLICAEALSAAGSVDDARALAVQVQERVGGQVERLFAGEAQGAAWPTAGPPAPLAEHTVPFGGLVGGAEVYTSTPEQWSSSVAAEPEEGDAALAGAGARELEEAIESGELITVPDRLALLLRHEPDQAASILAQADRALEVCGPEAPSSAALHIVRGDALQVLGLVHDAEAAYRRAVRAVATRLSSEEMP